MFQGAKGSVWATTDSDEIVRILPDNKSIQYPDPTKGRSGSFIIWNRGLKAKFGPEQTGESLCSGKYFFI